MIKFNPQKSVSHLLIIICIVISILGFISQQFFYSFALNSAVLMNGDIFQILSQVAMFQFLHGDVIHLLFNIYFLYTFGPEIEARMSKDKFITFFILTTLLVAVAITQFSSGITIGISGFCMALLAYLAMDLYATRHYAFNNIVIMLIFNIAIGLFAGISFTGHFFGAIAGIIAWFIFSKNKNIFK